MKDQRYRIVMSLLGYLEVFESIMDAIRRDKQLKNWKRAWKDDLINTTNPEWNELRLEIRVDDAFDLEVIADQVRYDWEVLLLSSIAWSKSQGNITVLKDNIGLARKWI